MYMKEFLLFVFGMLPFLLGCSGDKVADNGGDTPPPDVPEVVYVPSSGTIAERMKGAKINGEKVVAKVDELADSPFFGVGRYMVYFHQPVDHKDDSSETFSQRVIVCVDDLARPVAFVTQGYGLGNGWRFEETDYTEELVDLLGCNQVIVEHRYFQDSTPFDCDWTFHTVENQVNDLHRINLVMRELFKDQKFISTGRSKGGQTAIYYESYFPQDIDIAVPYVAPICFQMNDMRHAEFLKKVGDSSRRAKIKALQQEAFNRREALVKLLSFSGGDYSTTADILFDLSVLEYSFMCWQYDASREIPVASQLSDRALLNELNYISPISYFSHKGNPPFIMNILRDGGYYGYDVTQFSNTVITQAQCNRWIEDIVAPLDGRTFSFDPALGVKVKTFLKENVTEKMIFIYGGFDTWSAAAVEEENFVGKNNMFRYICPGGDHGTFIRSFDSDTQQEIIGKIKAWLRE